MSDRFAAASDRPAVTPSDYSSTSNCWAIVTSYRWILDEYDRRDTAEGTVTAVEEFCFSDATGFLERRRTLLGATEGGTDVLVRYVDTNGGGNVDVERHFGGDRASLDPANSTATPCAVLLGTEEQLMRLGEVVAQVADRLVGEGEITQDQRDRIVAEYDVQRIMREAVANEPGKDLRDELEE